MLQPAPADAGFKGGAEHQPRLAGLQCRQQRARVALLAGAPHLPAGPGGPQLRMQLQRLIQRHRHLGRQELQPRLIDRIEGLLQPLEPRLLRQAFGPGQGGGAIPAPVGIQSQAGRGGEALQAPVLGVLAMFPFEDATAATLAGPARA